MYVKYNKDIESESRRTATGLDCGRRHTATSIRYFGHVCRITYNRYLNLPMHGYIHGQRSVEDDPKRNSRKI